MSRLNREVSRTGAARVVVVCATPPHFNPGMLGADIALDVVLRRHGLDVEIDRRVMYTPLEMHQRGIGGSINDFGLPLGYRAMRSDDAQLEQAPAILFWGDFIHSRGHRGDVAQILSRSGLTSTEAEALALIDRRLFLNDQPPDVLARCMLFGNCLLTETQEAHPNDLYERQLQRLVQGANGVWMRDVLSAQRAAELRKSSSQSNLGLDCALLLLPEDCVAIAGAAGDRRPQRAGVFFGRTHQDPALLLHFAAELCRKLEVQAAWLPWFSATALAPEVVGRCWPDLAVTQPRETLSFALGALLRCDFVITDAYHLCVNAWNNGIPAVCVGRGASRFTTSISDKKKELFFLTYGAARFYVFAEQLEQIVGRASNSAPSQPPPPLDVVPPTLEYLAEQLRNRHLIASIQRRIAAQRDMVERQFIQSLTTLLEARTGRAQRLFLRAARTVAPRFVKNLTRRTLTGIEALAARSRSRSPFH